MPLKLLKFVVDCQLFNFGDTYFHEDNSVKRNSLDLYCCHRASHTMKYGGGVLHNFVFTQFLFKTVSGDVTAFHRIFFVI